MKLSFHGGVGTVTGSNFLLEDDSEKPLRILVDCGLAQGIPSAEAKNWEKFPYDPRDIDFLVVTHAHIDHIGRIPKLVREGFHGTIISTEATRALAAPMLEDSRELLKEAAEHHARPILYDEKDIADALRLWKGVFYHEPVSLWNDVQVQFLPAGHILGAGQAQFSRLPVGALAKEGGANKIIFSGDLGGHSDLLDPAESPQGAQYLVMESVYGDRTHNEGEHHRDKLEHITKETHQRGGTLLIPAFSTERTQDLLFDVRTLLHEKKIPSMPVFLDSPLAIKITRVFMGHPRYFKSEITSAIERGEDLFSFPELRFAETPEESRHIAATSGPKIIIAGSGMSSGGRVLKHEKEILADKHSTLCIVGYQSAGSIGRRLLDNEKKVEIMGEKVLVRARIEHIFSYSAHKDSPELVDFATQAAETLKEVFVVMGEPAASAYLAQRLRDYAGIKAHVPKVGESVQIELNILKGDTF